jgi:hypothetical protein
MADITPDTIICQFSADAGQWVSHFEPRPHIAVGGDLPGIAIHWLLEVTEAAPTANHV